MRSILQLRVPQDPGDTYQLGGLTSALRSEEAPAVVRFRDPQTGTIYAARTFGKQEVGNKTDTPTALRRKSEKTVASSQESSQTSWRARPLHRISACTTVRKGCWLSVERICGENRSLRPPT